MRKVDLRMNELQKYDIIKKLVDTNGNKKRAAKKLNCTIRTIDRLIKKYKLEGKSGFIHKNRRRQPAHTFTSEKKQEIMNLYTQKYSDANFTHFCELLAKNENIIISSTTIRNWLFAQDILSPKARRKTIKKLKADIKQREKTLTKKEANISTTIKLESLSRHEAHPRRSRCAYAGELIQLDASPHVWFGSTMTHLHLAIDDATGMIVGAYFDKQETLKAYYNVQYQILTTYGIPAKYLTDRRTIFDYKRKNAPSDSEDTFTQFAYACHQLGIELESTSVPQAKGRVERLNQTLQSRLVVEMRLASVDSIESANKFISSYIKEYNLQFSIPLNSTKNVYEKQPTFPQIDKILAVISNRKLDAGHCIRYKNKYYIPIARSGSEAYFHKGAHALVIESFSGKLYVNISDNLFALKEIPPRQKLSPTFDTFVQVKPKRVYIPPMSHPWKQASFNTYLYKQKHRQNGANI